MLNNVLKVVVPVFVGLLIIGAMMSVDWASTSELERYTIEVSSAMKVIVNEEEKLPHPAFDSSMMSYDLAPGDKLIVTRVPSRGIASPRGFAVTHILGWLPDGTRVHIPYIQLRKQSEWRV